MTTPQNPRDPRDPQDPQHQPTPYGVPQDPGAQNPQNQYAAPAQQFTPQGPGMQPGMPYGAAPYGAPQAPQTPKKPFYKRVWFIVLMVLVVLFVLIVGGCTALVGKAVDDVDKQSAEVIEFTYTVDGSGAGSVTYTAENNQTAQETDAAFPWSRAVNIDGFVKYASVIATNDIYNEGELRCAISVNGREIVSNVSSGAGATVSCNATDSDVDKVTGGQ